MRCLATVDTAVGYPAQGPTLSPLQVMTAQPAQLKAIYLLQPLLRRQFFEDVAYRGRVLLVLEHHTFHFASGSQGFGGGKCTFFWSALRLSVVAMTLAFCSMEFPGLYQPPGPSEYGNLCTLWRGIGLGSTCRSLVATMLMAYSSRSSTNSANAHVLSTAGHLP